MLGGGSKTIVTSASNPEESYYLDGGEWKDFYYYDDPSGFQNTGNFCIKALGTGGIVGVNNAFENNNTGLNSYPNPFTDNTNITFSLTENAEVSIRISNIVGQTVWTNSMDVSLGEHSIVWNGSNNEGVVLEKGMYIVELMINNELKSTNKILKSK